MDKGFKGFIRYGQGKRSGMRQAHASTLARLVSKGAMTPQEALQSRADMQRSWSTRPCRDLVQMVRRKRRKLS